MFVHESLAVNLSVLDFRVNAQLCYISYFDEALWFVHKLFFWPSVTPFRIVTFTFHVPTEPNPPFITLDVTAKYNRSQFAQQWEISKTFACVKKRRSLVKANFKVQWTRLFKTSEKFQSKDGPLTGHSVFARIISKR